MASDPPKLPVKTLHDVTFAYRRYVGAFDSDQPVIETTVIPGPESLQPMSPWIIEAPLNSVEIIEVILKPPQPLQVHTARHIERRPPHPTTRIADSIRKILYRRYNEFIQFQGRLSEEREVRFVIVPSTTINTIRERLGGTFSPVYLHYISIPWSYRANGRAHLVHPFGLVLHDKSHPGTIHTYENRLRMLLEELGIPNCSFSRSLLRPNTTPIPENIWDWFVGVPGTTAAIPYYESRVGMDESERNDRVSLVEEESNSTTLPTTEQSVNAVTDSAEISKHPNTEQKKTESGTAISGKRLEREETEPQGCRMAKRLRTAHATEELETPEVML